EFVIENLSNWFVRLSRKRYWGGEFDVGKISAYQTLYACLVNVAKLMAPIAPFYADLLYTDLNRVTGKEPDLSVHIANFPTFDESLIDKDLEEKMAIAQKASSMILALRRKEKIKVRQPLGKILVPVLSERFEEQFESVKNVILTEVNVKEVEYVTDAAGIISKKIKPNFKTLGPKYGKLMKEISAAVSKFGKEDISRLEREGLINIRAGEQEIPLLVEDVDITTEDIPGWQVASEGNLTIALDIHITPELKMEGIAREFINKIQNLRKDNGYEVTDRISLEIKRHPQLDDAVEAFSTYICTQTLADGLALADETGASAKLVEIDAGIETFIRIEKLK
ncbi:MAG: DUF5915 domain-containing protein, partial [Prolixibacteraceae bacterium]|nr:DUF5915 domain-containing protein [Prolixibacteraceae bacterium]